MSLPPRVGLLRKNALPFWGLVLFLSLLALTLLLLNVPAGFPQPQFWSPRPNHSVEVSTLYRQSLSLPEIPFRQNAFHTLHLLLLVVAFVAYLGAIKNISAKLPWRLVLAVTALILVALVFLPPLYATDVFYYAISGQISGGLHANPYLQPPASFPNSPLLPFNYWVDITTPYGPAWTLIAAAVAWMTHADPFWTTVLFKTLGALAVLGGAFFIYTILKNTRPQAAAKGTLLFLWNPVVLLEGIGNAHNDILIAALVLVAAWMLVSRKRVLGFIALILATWVKYLTVPLAAFDLLVRLRSRRWKEFAILLVLGAILTLLLWLPFWIGLGTLSSLAAESTRGLSGPIPFTLALLSRFLPFLQPALPALALTLTIVALFAAAFWGIKHLWGMWRAGPAYSPLAEVTAWGTIAALIPLLLPRAHPWFLLPALGLLAVVWPQVPRRTLAVYMLAGLWFLIRAGTW